MLQFIGSQKNQTHNLATEQQQRRILPLCLTVKLKCLCSAHKEIIWPCLPVNGYKKEEINTYLSKGWPFPEMFYKTEDPFYFTSSLSLPLYSASPSLFCLWTSVPHCFSLSGSIKEPDIQIPARWLLWDISLPSPRSASFPNSHILCLNTSSLGFIGLWRVQQSKFRLGNSITQLFHQILTKMWLYLVDVINIYSLLHSVIRVGFHQFKARSKIWVSQRRNSALRLHQL